MSANQEIMRVVRTVIREDADAAKAVSAMRQRGLSRKEAQEEIARAVLGCLWEGSRGLPNRWVSVLEALGRGSTAASLFPNELDHGPTSPPH